MGTKEAGGMTEGKEAATGSVSGINKVVVR